MAGGADGSLTFKVYFDTSDVNAGVKDIGSQLKKAGETAARAGKSLGKSMSKGWGYDQGAVDFMENFGKALEKDGKAAIEAMKYYDQQGVSAENAAKSVRELAEEEEKAAAAAKRATGAGATRSEGAADTLHKQVQSAQKALADLSKQGLGPGDAKWDQAYQATAQLRAEEKAYLADLAKTPEQREREAEAIAKAEAKAEELRQKEEARAEAARKKEEAEAAEAQRLADIAQQAEVGNQAIVSLTRELEQLQARQRDLNAAGVGTGYTEYDANAQRIRAVTAALREYAATGSDAAAQTLVQVPEQTTAWGRVREVLAGVAERMGLVRRQTDDTSGAMVSLRSSAGAAASSMGSMFKKVLKWGLGIRSTFILVRKLRNAVKEGFTVMAKHDTETAETLERLKTALSNVKVSLAVAFKPILTAVAPLLEKLCTLATRAANAVARFFAVLSGRGSYTRVVTGAASTISNAMGGVAVASVSAAAGVKQMSANMNTAKIAATGAAEGVAAAAEAAKDAAQNLSGLDELNIWQENKDASGGGGGGGGDDDLGIETEEVPVEASDFLVRFKDILFEWENMNPELIAEKILTGLCTAAGGIIGFKLGGVKGALVGLTLGALLGVKLSEITFNGDGKIDKNEAGKLFVASAVGLIGAIVGAIVGKSGILSAVVGGSAGGAAIGLVLGVAITLRLLSVTPEEISKNVGNTLQNYSETFSPEVGIGTLVGRVDEGLMTQEEALKAVHDAYGVVIDDYGELADAVHYGTPLPKELTDAMPKGKFAQWWDGIKDWWNKKVSEPVGEVWVDVKNTAAECWDKVKGWWNNVVGKVADFWTDVKNDSKEWWKKVKTWWSKKVGAVKEFTTNVANKAADWWKNVQTWWGKKVGAVKEFTTNVSNHAATWWSNVKTWWSSKVGAVKEFTTNVANHAATWWGNTKNWWGAKVGAVKEFTTNVSNHAATWWGNVKNWWGGKVGAVKNFTTSVNNTAATWWSNVKTWWAEKSAGGVSFTAKITSFVDALKNKVLDFQAKITSFIDAIKNKTLSFTATLTGALSYLIPGARLAVKATGGIYTSGGWQPVEGYAGGGSPRSGRLFIANENGMPELVGTIGGHTAVMNNGQIVSSVAAGVYQAVAAAASQVGGWFRSMSAELANIPPAIKMLTAMPAQTPMPVMASGTVLPPRAAYAADEAAELKAAVRELRDALLGGGYGQNTPVVVNVALDGQVDGRNLFRAVQTQARIEKRVTGRDPFAG